MNSGGDKAALWAQLQEIHQKEVEDLNEEKKRLKAEKETMGGVTSDPSDIVEINVGGEVILQCHRRTLCLAPDSMFSHIFSGRWDGSCARDGEGRVFLDHDPELVRLIVNHLRIKRIEDPSKPLGPPQVPEGKKKEWNCMLRYFGLSSFFYPAGIGFWGNCSDVELVQPGGLEVTKTRKTDQSLQLTFNGRGHHFAACQPALDAATRPCWWKITIDTLPNNCWIYVGIIGNLNADSKTSYSDPTSYGYACSDQTYQGGRNRPGYSNWTAFVEGECLYFQFNDNKLDMYSVQKSQVYTFDDIPDGEKYVHFNFYDSGTKVTLAPLSVAERATFASKLGDA